MTCYYHSKDLDGWCSGHLLRLKHPQAKMIGYHYGEPFEFPEGDSVMADVSLPMTEMTKLMEIGDFTWIDHHASAIKDYLDSGNRFLTHLSTEKSACELVWEYYFGGEAPEAVTLLGEYDTWRNQDRDKWDERILPFQYGMRLVCNSLETFPDLSMDVDAVIEKGKIVLKYQESQNESACKGVFFREVKGHRAVCLNTNVKSSNVFASVKEDFAVMLPFSFEGSVWHFTIYTVKDIDVSLIAKSFGGGGHKKAAGFQVKNLKDVL